MALPTSIALGRGANNRDLEQPEDCHMYISASTQTADETTKLVSSTQPAGSTEPKPNMWTTPGIRPLIESPILDWQWFQRKHIYSDLRYLALFPSNPEKRARMKDLTGEKEMLFEYVACVKNMESDSDTPPMRKEFYHNLASDLEEEWGRVNKEHLDLWSTATSLGRFEYRKLDNDGGTKRIEEWLRKGADFSRQYGEEVLEKYGYLVPRDFKVDELATFEFEWLDHDGRTTILEYDIKKGDDVFKGCGEQVMKKYGHLRSLLPAAAIEKAGSAKRPRTESCGSHEDSKKPRAESHSGLSFVYSMEARA